MNAVADFLSPISLAMINEDAPYTAGQLGKHVQAYDTYFPDVENVHLLIAGITEYRGDGQPHTSTGAADSIRKELYCLFGWHTDIQIADIGNIKTGATLADSYAAIQTVVSAAREAGKIILLLGGSHDCTLGQYYAYKKLSLHANATCIDARVDLSRENPIRSKNFLMEMLTSEPNYISHYSHLAFQSYFVHPHMLETLDKLRFDFHRVGQVSEKIEELEPLLRNTDLLSFDISALKHADAPASSSINGLSGVEACMLSRFAGMSEKLSSFGIYGFDESKDEKSFTAMQVSQMIWYFIDGLSKRFTESNLQDRDNFNEYNTAFAEIETLFLQSKKTRRWWMQMPDKSFTPCSQSDYYTASNNDIPERWLRIQER